jgi:hypothetical protein
MRKRKTIPKKLTHSQITSLKELFLEEDFNFFDSTTLLQFQNLLENYLSTEGGLAVLERLRLKDIINQLPEKLFNKFDKILLPEVQCAIQVKPSIFHPVAKNPISTSATPISKTEPEKNTPSLFWRLLGY